MIGESCVLTALKNGSYEFLKFFLSLAHDEDYRHTLKKLIRKGQQEFDVALQRKDRCSQLILDFRQKKYPCAPSWMEGMPIFVQSEQVSVLDDFVVSKGLQEKINEQMILKKKTSMAELLQAPEKTIKDLKRSSNSNLHLNLPQPKVKLLMQNFTAVANESEESDLKLIK